MIEPYYRSDDGAITVYCARWEDVHAAGLVPVEQVKLVHADPPYGVGGMNGAGRGGTRRKTARRDGRGCTDREWPPLVGGRERFDAAPLLALDRPTVMWGANHYDNLPGASGWLIWDKRDGAAPCAFADAELAWTNLGGPARMFPHRWSGLIRASENGEASLHPTQKPVALSTWIFQRAKLRPGDLVFVPYLGSGPDLAAAVAMGLHVIACDVEEWCCRTAVSARLRAMPHPDPAASLGPLFGGAR